MLLQLFEVLLKLLNEVFFLVEVFNQLFTHCLLMVAKNSHLLVGFFIFLKLFLHGQALQTDFF